MDITLTTKIDGEFLNGFQKAENEPVIVPHSEVMDVIRKRKIEYSLSSPSVTFVEGGLEIVFICKMKDPETGISACGVGETNPKNIDTAIAAKFPAEVAANRAIDRTLIKLLGLNTGVYSNMEISILGGDQAAEPATEAKKDAEPLPEEFTEEASSPVPAPKPESKPEPVKEAPKGAELKAEDFDEDDPFPEVEGLDVPEETETIPDYVPDDLVDGNPEEAPETEEEEYRVNGSDVLKFGHFAGKTLDEVKGTKPFREMIKFISSGKHLKLKDPEAQKQFDWFVSQVESGKEAF